MLLSPTEHQLHKYDLGPIHQAPETYGCDILIVWKGRKLGVQSKTVPDLLASVEDGRLARGVGMMQEVDQAVLLIEGRMAFSGDGVLMGRDYGRQWTRESIQKLLWSARQKGLWVQHTDGLGETVETLRALESWWRKGSHSALETRPGATSPWGTAPTNRDYGIYVLQSFPGIGPELAARIYDEHQLPLQWTITKEQLMQIPGIGEVRARRVVDALGGEK